MPTGVVPNIPVFVVLILLQVSAEYIDAIYSLKFGIVHTSSNNVIEETANLLSKIKMRG
jgi:hypothetical protein